MISPKRFYRASDEPSRKRIGALWRSVERELLPTSTHPRRFDFVSFAFGMAAAVAAFFVLVGVYTTLHEVAESSRPLAVKLDIAYNNAISGFEEVALPVHSDSDRSPRAALRESRLEALRSLNSAIAQFQSEAGSRDISSVRQEQLRQLYSRKLRLLETMVEEGDIRL